MVNYFVEKGSPLLNMNVFMLYWLAKISNKTFFSKLWNSIVFYQVIKYKLGLNIDTLLTAVHSSCKSCLSQGHAGGFHPHLLVFPFVHQFNFRIWVLVQSSFANDKFRRISTSFQHHLKICLMWFLHKKECSFYTHHFPCTEMRWLFISSTAIWVTGSDTRSVASTARSKLTTSKCDWTRIWTM